MLEFFFTFFLSLPLHANPCSKTIINIHPDKPGVSYTPSNEFNAGIDTVIAFIRTSLPNTAELRYYPSSKPMGPVAINLLISQRTYLLGHSQSKQYADGKPMSPDEFLKHDFFHAKFVDSYISRFIHRKKASLDFLRKFIFSYEQLRMSLSPKNQFLFDFAYFLYFHEGYGFAEIESLTEELNLHNTSAQNQELIHELNRLYQKEIRFHFQVQIHENEQVSATLKEYFLFNRLLDEHDLWVHLPLEIQTLFSKIDETTQIIILSSFIEEMFSIFYTMQFRVIKEIFLTHQNRVQEKALQY